jgi:hypothetical protein
VRAFDTSVESMIGECLNVESGRECYLYGVMSYKTGNCVYVVGSPFRYNVYIIYLFVEPQFIIPYYTVSVNKNIFIVSCLE